MLLWELGDREEWTPVIGILKLWTPSPSEDVGEPERVNPYKIENLLKNSVYRTQVSNYWSAVVDQRELVTEIDCMLDSIHEDEPLADFSRQRVDAKKRERLMQAIKMGVKIKYQTQIPEAFADRRKAMQSGLEELQRQNISIGKLKMLMSAIEVENEIQNYLDLEQKERHC